jgi:tripartite-type tricarboxylate transporter receptor subunit TctC
MTLLGKKDLPPNNLAELIAYVKANADKLNLAHAGLGAVSHLCGVLLRQAMGVDMTTVPFQGTGPAMNALLGGQVDLLCDQTTSTTPFIKAQSVKLYGVTTPARLKTLPETPTLAEQGLTGFQVVVWHGIYAPKGTPKDVVDKLNAEVNKILAQAETRQKLKDLGFDVGGGSAKQLADFGTAERAKWGPLIKSAGMKAE